MTDTSLRYSGLDILCREKPHHYIMVTASNARYLGQEKLPAGDADHFQMAWGDGASHQTDLWFSTGDKPFLLRTSSSIEFAADQDAKHAISVTADLTWKTAEQYADERFVAHIPEDSVEVADLFSYLADGGTQDLRGQPSPPVDLKLLDGSVWNLQQHRDKQIVVLYFFATWAAPSREEIPELLAAVRKHEDRGVVFYAVNVGETPDVVQAMVDAYHYTHPVVLDPRRQGAKSFRVTSLPTAVVIGRDGTIQAAHVGNTAVVREQIRKDLEQLIEGKPLSEAGD